MTTQPFSVSIVVPFYNEEALLPALHAALLSAVSGFPFLVSDIIYVNDGSSDSSLSALQHAAGNLQTVHLISLEHHSGKTEALHAGFSVATGNIIVTLDADLQNDPMDIPALVQAVMDGNDMAVGWRHTRQDSIVRCAQASLFNHVLNCFTSHPLHDANCGLKAMRFELARQLPARHEWHRFFCLIAMRQGRHVVEIPIRHHSRQAGRSKYGIGRMLRIPLDLWRVLLYS